MRFQNLLESNNDQESEVLIYGLLLLSHFSRVRLCDPIDGSPLGSSVPGILQARILEWVAISFSNSLILSYPQMCKIKKQPAPAQRSGLQFTHMNSEESKIPL